MVLQSSWWGSGVYVAHYPSIRVPRWFVFAYPHPLPPTDNEYWILAQPWKSLASEKSPLWRAQSSVPGFIVTLPLNPILDRGVQIPACWPIVVSLLGRRQRRWPNKETTLDRRFVPGLSSVPVETRILIPCRHMWETLWVLSPRIFSPPPLSDLDQLRPYLAWDLNNPHVNINPAPCASVFKIPIATTGAAIRKWG